MKRYGFIFLMFLCASVWSSESGELLKPFVMVGEAGSVKSTGTVKICALRVEFIPDNEKGTTGDGRFLKESNIDCGFVVDPPPHNREYFKDHIKALSNYYYHASHGRLIIDTLNSEVFPVEDDSVYVLPHKMSYYHPFSKEDSIDIRLVELFVDAVKLADGDVDFSRYDLVVVFHAGVGQDFNITLDPTPFDIPSVYLGPSNFEEVSSEVFPYSKGVPVDSGQTLINRGIILPETQNHLLYPEGKDIFAGYEDLCEYQIALNGTFALMFGFYLGLPALFNTETGESGIGKFGLMDQGSMNLNGFVPALPSAWERVYMGWEEPIIAEGDVVVRLKHAESGADTTVWKVPINDREYFLIENRYSFVRPGVTIDSLQYKEYLDTKEWPSIFPYIKDSIGAVFSPRTGVLLSVPRYDVGLPGSGLLIWHIDEGVIRENISSYGVNNDVHRRGVDLEEADGAQDIGYESTTIGPNTGLGWYFDPWFAGNEGFFHLNPDYPVDSMRTIGFTPQTNPSTCSNDYSYTGIRIDSIGPAGQEMFFRIGFDRTVYRINIKKGIKTEPLVLNIDSQPVVIVFSDSLYLFEIEGRLLSASDFLGLFESDSVQVSFVTFVDSNIVTLAEEKGKVYLIKYGISSDEVRFTGKFTYSIPRINPSVLSDGRDVVFASGDTVFYWSISGGDIVKKHIGHGILRLAGGGELPVYALCADGLMVEVNSGEVLQDILLEDFDSSFYPDGTFLVLGFLNDNEFVDFGIVNGYSLYLIKDVGTEQQRVRTEKLYEPGRDLILSDIDGDGQVEVVVVSERWLYVFNKELYFESGFPLELAGLYDGKLFLSGILSADITDDGNNDIIVEVEGSGVIGYEKDGSVIDKFPMAVRRARNYLPQIVNIDGMWYYVTVTPDIKSVDLLSLGRGGEKSAWTCYGANYFRNFYQPQKSQVVVSGGSGILDWDKVYCWPNPARDNYTNIRFYVNNRECSVEVEIYDISGNRIGKLRAESVALNDYNEIKWDVSNVQNGVYFAVVKAKASGKEDSKVIKILVTR